MQIVSIYTMNAALDLCVCVCLCVRVSVCICLCAHSSSAAALFGIQNMHHEVGETERAQEKEV